LASAVAEDRMSQLSQANYPASLKTPLGDNVLVLKTFSGNETLGQPFEFHVEALSEEENIDFDKALGQACTIKLKTYEQKERFFCGILTEAQWVGTGTGGQRGYSHYRLVLRPWVSLLAHRANCRIFPKMKVTEIIEKVFSDAGFSSGTDFKFCTHGTYEEIEYCAQYRETDFAFVSRLMEQYGIYYFFEHQDGQHTMMLADSYASHSKVKDLPTVKYNSQTVAYNRAEQHIHSWISDRRFCTGRVELRDYDYLQPNVLKASKDVKENYARSTFEVYDYPGKYDKQKQKMGDLFAQVRLEAEQALDRRRTANGDAPSLFAGGIVTLEKHPTSKENDEYLVVRASHDYGNQFYGTSQAGDGAGYQGNYEFLPSDRPFRSLPLTPKPRIHGIQTAKVVANEGEDKEEISTDKHGHIWVQFYWDREPKKSCPIRVSQPWAGKKWGHQFIPRIGMEVVVEFLEGDPDRPLVIGCVYNGDNKTPFVLPSKKNISGVVSDSTKGHHGHNFFTFDDTKGNETVFLHAEKDYQLQVLDSEKRVIRNNREAVLQEGNDDLRVEQGDRQVQVWKGKHFTTVSNEVNVESGKEVHLSVLMGVTTIALDAKGISMKAGEVQITAPIVRITGNVVISGNLAMTGGLVAGAALIGGRPV
jgi:type VI secretion system secreted protein VgrG